jgi:hypothetical protein
VARRVRELFSREFRELPRNDGKTMVLNSDPAKVPENLEATRTNPETTPINRKENRILGKNLLCVFSNKEVK